ncbi:hypothetical protein GEMRC1_006205 [Eukaryota sp. GEM-RC1]
MPYHSNWNNYIGAGDAGIVYLPLKTDIPGPAPICESDKEDIVEETLRHFKANVLCKQFHVTGPADRLLIYLTWCALRFLRRLEDVNTIDDANKLLFVISQEEVTIPGQKIL